jgi:uncharacterized membrane protein YhiD involved in acid resistance
VRLAKFMQLFHASLMPMTPVYPPRPDLRMPYQLDVVCHAADIDEISRLIRQHLTLSLADAQAMFVAPQLRGDLTQLTLRVLCSKAGHASLVRLVHRLGLERTVRSVQWRPVTSQPLN